jgi:hypothetical protein
MPSKRSGPVEARDPVEGLSAAGEVSDPSQEGAVVVGAARDQDQPLQGARQVAPPGELGESLGARRAREEGQEVTISLARVLARRAGASRVEDLL